MHAYPTSPSPAPSDAWYVTNGLISEGPLTFEALRRRVVEGTVVGSSLVRHRSWNIWRQLDEIDALTADQRAEMIQNLSVLSANLDETGAGPYSVPPPPPSSEELYRSARRSGPVPRSSARPIAVDPVSVLAPTASLSEALLLTLSTAMTAASAEVGVMHRYHRSGGTVTTGAVGQGAEGLLGEKLDDDDPALLAALSGRSVLVEPFPGDAGRFIVGRVGRCLTNPQGAAMVPLRLYDRLVAMFEVGRNGLPFRARDVSRVEDVVEALAERAVVMGWLDD